MYKCKHFDIEELVPPELFVMLHNDDLWRLFDPNILKAADWLRERYGPATINDWKWGGNFTQSGIRTTDSEYYSATSQHSIGCALDMKLNYNTMET